MAPDHGRRGRAGPHLHRRARGRGVRPDAALRGSSVVVLERFARTARNPGWILFFAAVASGLCAVFVLRFRWLEDFLGPAGPSLWLTALVAAGVATAVAIARLPARAARAWPAPVRGTVVLVGLALAGGLWLGSTGRVLLVVAPALSLLALAVAAGVLRRRGGPSAPASGLERQLAAVAACLFAGSLLAAVLPAADPRLAAAGERIFQVVFAFILLGLVPLAAAGLVEAAPLRRVVHRHPLSRRQAPAGLHLGDHRDLHRRHRGRRLADHHRALGDERLRADLARGDPRQPRALHRARACGSHAGRRGAARGRDRELRGRGGDGARGSGRRGRRPVPRRRRHGAGARRRRRSACACAAWIRCASAR